MSAQRRTSSARGRRKSADAPTFGSFIWPIVVGALLTILTIRIGGILALMGQEQFAVVYPWVALVKSPVLGIDYGSAVAMGQVLLYFQYPIYGFIAGAVLYVSNSLSRALFTVLGTHMFALIIFIAITIFHPS